MAYSTGTASDIDDLINVKLKAFAIANGWTVNEDNWPTFISLSKGTCFVNFQRYLASGTDPFGYPYTDHRLYARISSGYGPGGFTGQPNVAAYDAIANDLTGPFHLLPLFLGPDSRPTVHTRCYRNSGRVLCAHFLRRSRYTNARHHPSPGVSCGFLLPLVGIFGQPKREV
jgi:hypothetical protein